MEAMVVLVITAAAAAIMAGARTGIANGVMMVTGHMVTGSLLALHQVDRERHLMAMVASRVLSEVSSRDLLARSSTSRVGVVRQARAADSGGLGAGTHAHRGGILRRGVIRRW